MVDAANTISGTDDPAIELTPMLHFDAEAARIHGAVAAGRTQAPAQHPLWVSNWIARSGAKTFVAALHDAAGRPVLSLPLEVVQINAVKTARYMAGTHANGNFPAMVPDCPELGADALKLLSEHIGRARPDIDLLALERQAAEIDGAANPFLELPHSPSPNQALAVSLKGGFDNVLSRPSGKRKRKKHRSQSRKFEAMGPWRRIQGQTPQQATEMLDLFFVMKRERFRQFGIPNAFADEGVVRFLHGLFAEAAAGPNPDFVLHGLEVAGKIRAVTGSSISGDRIVCEFSSFAIDDTARASPGEFLFFEDIEQACKLGLSVYDFSVGDEPYKRLWCDIFQTQFDCLIPLNAKGKLAAVGFKAAGEVKRVLKSNDRLWKAAKKIRRSVAGG